MLDDEVIGGDYTQRMVDEKYILKVIVSTVGDSSKRQAVDVVRLLTRTEENIRQAGEIRIRGEEKK